MKFRYVWDRSAGSRKGMKRGKRHLSTEIFAQGRPIPDADRRREAAIGFSIQPYNWGIQLARYSRDLGALIPCELSILFQLPASPREAAVEEKWNMAIPMSMR